MYEFVLDECKNQKSDKVAESQEILGILPADIYKSPENIAKLATIIKEQRGQNFCMLPFCHTLEAEMLGGNINLGDETAGARAGEPICDSTSDVLSLKVESKNEERLNNMFSAIEILKSQGEDVMFCITGPIGTLTCLVESRTIFKEWRRDSEKFNEVLDYLANILIDLALSASKAGACAIEYADPPAASSIVGPKFASELCERFTMRFVRELSKKLGKSVPVYLCPLSATNDMKTLDDVSVIAKCPKALKSLE